jgi:hypothetical protein
MTDISEYLTIDEAAADARVSYTRYWIRKLAQEQKVAAIKIGSDNRRGQWLIHLPSLLSYIEQMQELGTLKHSPQR